MTDDYVQKMDVALKRLAALADAAKARKQWQRRQLEKALPLLERHAAAGDEIAAQLLHDIRAELAAPEEATPPAPQEEQV